MNRFFYLPAVMVALTSCTAPLDSSLSLAPVPYTMAVPEAIISRLSVAPLTGPYGEVVHQAGAVAAAMVYYTPESGQATIFMAAYYFPAESFDAAQNPQEPPPFGQPVIRSQGYVLSIAGPTDMMFDPGSEDGRNISTLNGRIYQSETYSQNL